MLGHFTPPPNTPTICEPLYICIGGTSDKGLELTYSEK